MQKMDDWMEDAAERMAARGWWKEGCSFQYFRSQSISDRVNTEAATDTSTPTRDPGSDGMLNLILERM